MPLPTWSLVALLLALALAIPEQTKTGSPPSARPRATRGGVALRFVGIAALAFVARWLSFPRAFLHQNGQGAYWVQFALEGHVGVAAYGAGYAEVFAFAARAFPTRPELAITLVQATLGAISVAAMWLLARGLGARPLLAGAAAAWLALDPFSARAAQSESYFATVTSLLVIAAAVLVLGARRARPRSLRYWGWIGIAGLVVAQAARIHPVAWVPAATLPVLLLVGPGRPRRRLLASACAGVGIAIVVVAVTGPDVWSVLRGSLGQKWMPQTRSFALRGPDREWPLELLLPAALGLAVSWRRWPAALALLLVLWLSATTNLIADPNPSVVAAYSRLFTPILAGLAIVVAAGVPARLPPLLGGAGAASGSRAMSAVMALACVVGLARTLRLATTLPTDVREAAWVIEWRSKLPPGSRVHHVRRVGDRIVALPIYDAVVNGAHLAATLPGQSIAWDDAHAHYLVRTSLCSSSEARASCAELERSARLELVESRALPAIPSIRWLPYDTPEVRVELFRAWPR